jgi:hypothetical protein
VQSKYRIKMLSNTFKKRKKREKKQKVVGGKEEDITSWIDGKCNKTKKDW